MHPPPPPEFNGIHVAAMTCAFALAWQCFVWTLHKHRLPHLLFPLANHAAVSAVCTGVLYIRRLDVLKVLSLAYGYTEYLEETATSRWAHTATLLGANFIAYFCIDMLNSARYTRKFVFIDWAHHVLALCLTCSGLMFDSPNSVLAPLMGFQELSTIFLTSMNLGYKHVGIKLGFVFTFIATRVILGGFVAMAKTAQSLSCSSILASAAAASLPNTTTAATPLPPWCTPQSAVLTILSWVQLGINLYFVVLIIRKARKQD